MSWYQKYKESKKKKKKKKDKKKRPTKILEKLVDPYFIDQELGLMYQPPKGPAIAENEEEKLEKEAE